MKFDPAEIREAAEKDFDSAWKRGVDYLERPSLERIYPRRSYSHGRPHPVFETIQRLREAYLRMGFTEMMNPVIVDAQEVHRQFGSEALAVLDRCFYLAGLPRPDIGISENRLS
ncbi:MAG: O-phosphoserine--tRNA ligase, partial [Methanothrix sp.]